jgi:hypothetical protein
MKPGCHYCWSPFDKACTDAHLHGCRDDVVRLCWICNRAYDHDLFTTRELLDAVRVFEKARRLQCRMGELAAEWADGLESGMLHWNTRIHRDRPYRISVALDRGEIELIPGTADAYRSILVPSRPTNLKGRIAALKATKTRLTKKLSLVEPEPERGLLREQIHQLDRRVAAFQRELNG